MDILKTIFISIIQGITEFLPISSSGHIFLLKKIFNLELNATFDVVTHVGTLFAVIIIYFKEIKELSSGLLFKSIDSKYFGDNLIRSDYFRIFLLFIIATIPGGVAGLFLEKPLDIEPSSTKNWMFLILANCFLITMIFLISTYFIKNKKHDKVKRIIDLSYLNALFIGIFQAIAILPGVSRSGSTITAALHSKLNKNDSARFSFILSIPLIIAAFLLKLVKLIQSNEIADIKTMKLLIIALITSFLAGYISLKFLIKIIQKGKVWIFSLYLIIPIIVSCILYLIT